MSDKWIEETHNGITKWGFKIREHLYSKQSPFQKVDIYQTEGHGKVLLNDGVFMISERDEMVYHDMIAHPALFTHPNPERVLIIGGGDGGTLREVLRHPEVKKSTMVEIDAAVVDGCKEFIPQTSKAMDDPRADVLIEDGLKYIKETNEKFDVILVDSTDPVGPAEGLFGKEFYQDVIKVLADDGIVISQAESPFYESDKQRDLLKILSETFPKVHIFNYNNITYPGGLWSFSWASKGLCPIGDFNTERVDQLKLDCFFYNKDLHKAAFQLPEFMKKNLRNYLSDFKSF